MTAPKRAEVEAAAGVLREVLHKVGAGEIESAGRRDKAILARIEGVLLGLDLAVRGPSR